MFNRILQEATDEIIKMEFSLSAIFSYICSAAMIFGGVIPYVPQYRDIRKSKNAEGFSLYVCLALLLANSMRILFWFGHPFELPLLIQSVIMNLTTLAMIHLCISVRRQTQIIPSQSQTFTETVKKNDVDESSESLGHDHVSRVFLDFHPKYFWQWTDFFSYVEFLATFSTAVGFVMYLFVEVPLVVEGIGLLSLLSESMLGAPQFYRNFLNKSTMGMSKKMVLMWTVGDIYKTCYFIVKKVPLQFLVCGVLQVSIDLAIMTQIMMYRNTSGVLRFTKPVKLIS